VPTLEIHALSDLRSEAAALLAERFARQRAAEPLLPTVADFEPHLPAEGLVATVGAEAVAYLGGAVEDDTAYIRFAGVAAREPEAVRDLFCALAQEWGVSRFMVFVPASEPELVDAFFRLSFGKSATNAVREAEPAPAIDFGGTIRESEPADLRHFAELESMLWSNLRASPSFSGIAPTTMQDHEDGWADLWDDPELTWSWVAERDGRPVGGLVMYRRPYGDLRVPEDNVDLAFAGTVDEVRGDGVGLALTHHALSWAGTRGFRSVTTDWRETNLLASRFWPKRGFRPTYVRLYRAIP
jgi:GNAT superfamily N-acetyltransferase